MTALVVSTAPLSPGNCRTRAAAIGFLLAMHFHSIRCTSEPICPEPYYRNPQLLVPLTEDIGQIIFVDFILVFSLIAYKGRQH
ncbi:hypothetical protein JB92DRAFT_1203245 [Gautieria morchelliformis]|nr:hypothetical protein JB92DRAFT_1203245 [Gautieria morchelliformis]